jgi:hypothetical protein
MDGGAIWRRALAQTGWDLFGYGFYHRAKLISKSMSYKKRNQSYMNRAEDLVPFQIETKLRSQPPHSSFLFALEIFLFSFARSFSFIYFNNFWKLADAHIIILMFAVQFH